MDSGMREATGRADWRQAAGNASFGTVRMGWSMTGMWRIARGTLTAGLCGFLSSAGCSRETTPDPAGKPVSAATEEGREWRSLFDGGSLDAWRGYRRDRAPDGWQVVDGAITRVAEAGDLVTREQFGDFELTLEWRVAEGGNSGIMYRVTEDAAHTFETGPEMQVLDDDRHPDGRSRLTAAGAVYALYPAPAGVVKPAGEWNVARIVARGPRIEHWVNGVEVARYEIGTADWKARVAASKFRKWPGYGRAAAGHIALQDHGNRVSYRNIRIRALAP
jgi:hypothetical protein